MFGCIHKYRVRQGDVKEISARVKQGLVPLLEKTSGFQGYHVINTNDGFVTSVTLCDSLAAAETLNRTAIDWVTKNLPNALSDPEVTIGELTISLVHQPA